CWRFCRPRERSAMRRGLLLIAALSALVLTGCASTKAPPVTDVGPGFLKDEVSILQQSEQAEEELRRRGMLFDDPDLQRYLESVGRKVVPAAAAANIHFRFGVIREPTINAF